MVASSVRLERTSVRLTLNRKTAHKRCGFGSAALLFFFYFSRSLYPSLSLFLSRLVKMRWAHCSVIVEARGAAAFRATGSTTCAPRYGVSNLIHQRKGRRKCVQIIAIDRQRRLGRKKKNDQRSFECPLPMEGKINYKLPNQERHMLLSCMTTKLLLSSQFCHL